MKTRALSIIFSLFLCISCDFRKSVEKDLVTGMVTRGNGLSCENVRLTVDGETIQRNRFIYGEVFHVEFNNMEGFERADTRVYPGMSLLVTGPREDTVLWNQDLYADYTEGIDLSPLLLISTVTVADPMHSNGTYTLKVNIWDKKSDGTFTAEMDFDVIPNDQIEVESNQLTYQEIYLYSQQRARVITNQRASLNENIYILIEGLEGLAHEDDHVYVGLGMRVGDADGNLIINEEDLLAESVYTYRELQEQLAANFILTGTGVHNPVYVELNVWDKRGEGQMKISTQLHIE